MTDWVHPARTTAQARCTSPLCTRDGQIPGTLVMAVTLSERGWCTACEASPADDHGLREAA